jgi:hypothetical protein
MDEQQDKPGFRVSDRRRFTDTGDERAAAGEAGETEPAAGGEQTRGTQPPEAAAPEPVTFSTFVLGLSTQALLHLGEIASPLDGKVEQDLVAAKHMIDILGILRDKTRNNLEHGEEHLLDSILYDLRMRYVDLVRVSKKKEEA